MTEQTWPQPIVWNWNQHHHEMARARSIEASLPTYQQRIGEANQRAAEAAQRAADTKKVAEELRAAYADEGRKLTATRDNAEMLRRMVERECGELGLGVPPVPVEPPLRQTEGIPAVDQQQPNRDESRLWWPPPVAEREAIDPRPLPAGVEPLTQDDPLPPGLTDAAARDDGQAGERAVEAPFQPGPAPEGETDA